MEVALPKVLFGTSALGNLFAEPTHEEKKAVVEQILKCSPGAPLFDSAGKYGAGLALEELGKCLEELGVPADLPLISNKLGWKRVPLTTPEPTFEPGAWVNLKHDAVQAISYDGILECYAQGNELLGKYEAKIVSVHDPDEYLAGAKDEAELHQRRADVLGAYSPPGFTRGQGEPGRAAARRAPPPPPPPPKTSRRRASQVQGAGGAQGGGQSAVDWRGRQGH